MSLLSSGGSACQAPNLVYPVWSSTVGLSFRVYLPPSWLKKRNGAHVYTEIPTPPPADVPFDDRNVKQSTAPLASRCTSQTNTAWPPLVGAQSTPTRSPRRMSRGSIR